MTEKPLPPAHDAFLARSAAFAKSLDAPPGTFALVIRAGGVEVPVIGSVGDPGARLEATKQQRLRRAREALAGLERRGWRKW